LEQRFEQYPDIEDEQLYKTLYLLSLCMEHQREEYQRSFSEAMLKLTVQQRLLYQHPKKVQEKLGFMSKMRCFTQTIDPRDNHKITTYDKYLAFAKFMKDFIGFPEQNFVYTMDLGEVIDSLKLLKTQLVRKSDLVMPYGDVLDTSDFRIEAHYEARKQGIELEKQFEIEYGQMKEEELLGLNAKIAQQEELYQQMLTEETSKANETVEPIESELSAQLDYYQKPDSPEQTTTEENIRPKLVFELETLILGNGGAKVWKRIRSKNGCVLSNKECVAAIQILQEIKQVKEEDEKLTDGQTPKLPSKISQIMSRDRRSHFGNAEFEGMMLIRLNDTNRLVLDPKTGELVMAGDYH
jgi:hypothetical protein